nr:hypothetical protein [uncultured Rhodopila sp.]
MSEDLERLRQVRNAAEAEILQRPGVTGLDIGYKYVAGRRTDKIVIRVHVAEKKNVPVAERIPAAIDGVETDVIQSNNVLIADSALYNPLRGGIAISPTRMFGGDYNVGTLGALAFDNASGSLLILSNYHVLCVDDKWENYKDISQPDPMWGTVVAKVERGFRDSRGDCAVARVLTDRRSAIYAVEGIGAVQGIADPDFDLRVRKRGRTTGLTAGKVDGMSGTYGEVVNAVSIAPDAEADFCDHGDSGSVVLNEYNEVVGLLFAASERPGKKFGIMIPIRRVLADLKVSLAITMGDYDLASSSDRALAFDCDPNRAAAPKPDPKMRLDTLVFYRPGRGAISILRHAWEPRKHDKGIEINHFRTVYSHPDDGHATDIGGWDLTKGNDQVFAFDFARTGRLDHLVFYRPGEGAISIIRNDGSAAAPKFASVFKSESGIGVWDLRSSKDRGFAFDYDGSGRLDHLVFYRPGGESISIFRNDSSNAGLKFTSLFDSRSNGLGDWDLKGSNDQAFAFDYVGNGRLDHLVFYRPGEKSICIMKNNNAARYGHFDRVYFTNSQGIGKWDLRDGRDRIFAFDYEKKGTLDYLVIYRPGTGAMCILKNESRGEDIKFTDVYWQGDDGHANGIGGWDLRDARDTMFAFDHQKTGRLDHLVIYRPGERLLFILENDRGVFKPVYKTSAPSTWPDYSPLLP